jgi:hypothetical protein
VVIDLVALVFAGVLVAGVAVAIGCSNVGPSIGVAAAELEKLAPHYWNGVESKMSYKLIQAPSRVGPAWTPDQLPGTHTPKPARRPLFQAPPPRPVIAQQPPSFEDDFLALPGDDADLAGFWAESPSPLGRVA